MSALPLLRVAGVDAAGTGPLAGLLAEPDVTDVLVNGARDVWVDRGRGLVRADVGFASDEEVRRLAMRLAATAGRRLDTGSPFVDARLPGGLRLHAVLSPIADSAAYVSLRLHRRRPFALAELLAARSVDRAILSVLEAMVAARLSFVVSGGAGCGKTTLLAALLGQAARTERLVVVEDAAELNADHPHLVRLQARPPNVEGAGEVALRDLVRQALRMRPDRLIVGEARGPELLDMLLAANTGHEGTLTTLHANGVGDVPARVEALAMLSGIGRPAAHSLLAAALHAAVHVRRLGDGRRIVADIAVLDRQTGSDLVAARAVLTWGGDGPPVPLPEGCRRLHELIAARGITPPPLLRPQ